MKAILIVEMPKKCIDCPLAYKEDHFIYRCKVSEDQVDPNGIYCDCPLKPHQKAIPIEWIEKWLEAQERIVLISPPYYNQVRVPKMLEDWEKENEQSNN